MFQTLYPDKWFDRPARGDPRPSDPLTPFHVNRSGRLWTSNDTKNWRRYNYTYDVLMPQPTASAFTVLRAVPVNLPAVNPPAGELSNPSSGDNNNPEPATRSLEEQQPQNPGSGENVPDDAVLAHLKQYINSTYGQTRQAVRDSPQIKGNHNDYIVNVIYDP